MIDSRYTNYYIPLIRDFVHEVESLPHPDIKLMPAPFFPLFGKSYETSALKLMIMGQDTAWWGDIREFIAKEKAHPGCKLAEGLNSFRSQESTSWGGPRLEKEHGL